MPAGKWFKDGFSKEKRDNDIKKILFMIATIYVAGAFVFAIPAFGKFDSVNNSV